MPGDIFSGFNAIQNANIAQPQSSVPAIATLGNMIDVLEQRRAAREAAERQAQIDALNQRKQDDKDAYFRRKLDLQEGRQTSQEAFGRAKYNQDLMQKAQGAAAKGLHPGTQLFMDDAGNPVRVAPRFVPSDVAPASPAQPAPKQDLFRKASLEGTGVVAQALDQNPDADGPDELGMGPTDPNPAATRATEQRLMAGDHGGPIDLEAGPDSPDEAGLGEPDPNFEETQARRARMLKQSGDTGGPIDLANPPPPVNYQAQPPDEKTPAPDLHAPGVEGRENEQPHGQLMSPQDSSNRLNELGVPPLPQREEPPSYQTLQAAFDQRGQGEPQPQQATFKRGKWVYDMPNGQPFEIDLEQARQAHMEEVQAKLAQIDSALGDPSFALDPATVSAMRRERAMLSADLPSNDRSAILAQGGRADLQQSLEEGRNARQDKSIASREGLERLRQEGKIALQNAKRKRGGGGGLGIGSVTTGGGEYINIPQTKAGPRPDMLLGRVNTDWRSYSMDEKMPVQLLGLRRLKMADHNLGANGPNSGVLNIEAAFNYLGFIRGGVPVENETKEMLTERRTWADRIHGILAKAGLGEIAAKFQKGGELTKDEVAAAVNVMSPQEKARIGEGIKESLAVMNGQVNDTLKPFVMQYAALDGPGGKMMRQHAVSMVNARLASAGLPADFNPFNDTMVPGASRHMKESSAQSPTQALPVTPAQPSSQPSQIGKPSIRDLLENL